jgi:hypothetical protein
VYNDYQNTSFITLDPTNKNSLTRLEREWAMQVPRNAVKVNVGSNPDIFDVDNLSSATRMFAERIRDKYIIMDLEYNNTNNYKFNVPYITTGYRTSIR